MKKCFKFLPFLLLGFCVVLNSCSNDNESSPAIKGKSGAINYPSFLGLLHNSSLDDVMYYYYDENAENNDPLVNANNVINSLKSYLEGELNMSERSYENYAELEDLIIPENANTIFYGRNHPNFDLSNLETNYAYNVSESVSIINNSGLLDSYSQNVLNEYNSKLFLNYSGELSDQNLLNFCINQKENLVIHNNTTGSDNSELMTILEISINSLEWWSTFDERNTEARPKVAPWIAADLAGAVVGMGVAIIREEIKDSNSPVDGQAVLEGALWGGVLASTGVVGRLARWTRLW